jgi:hypothetical protein
MYKNVITSHIFCIVLIAICYYNVVKQLGKRLHKEAERSEVAVSRELSRFFK